MPKGKSDKQTQTPSKSTNVKIPSVRDRGYSKPDGLKATDWAKPERPLNPDDRPRKKSGK